MKKDIQKLKAERKIEIDKVGVKNIKVPLLVRTKKSKPQFTIADINLYVNLPHKYKGTHMSRFIEILNRHTKKVLSGKSLGEITKEVKKRLNAERAFLEVSFPYFMKKRSPISKKQSLLDYKCKLIREVDEKNKVKNIVEVTVPVTLLCPCSKEISSYGAHNQRAYITVRVCWNKLVWIEDLIALIEKEASCSIYPLLKRLDEKFVTEKAFENPKFVEDVVREIAFELNKFKKKDVIESYVVECESIESIHNHEAYAREEG